MERDQIPGGHVALFLAASMFGLIAAVVLYGLGDAGLVRAVIAFFLAGIGYTLAAAVAVMICKMLRRLSFPTLEDWDVESAVAWGVFWPGSLFFWLIVTPFFIVISRIFKRT